MVHFFCCPQILPKIIGLKPYLPWSAFPGRFEGDFIFFCYILIVSANRNKLGRAHLKVSRRRNDWVCKLAQRVIQSSDLVAIENLKVRNLIKNHCLAKSISDAAWHRFREWLEYFGGVYGVPVIAVNPSYTSQNCSKCGQKVVKTLSTRTHKCPHCNYIADRDENAARNILKSALKELSTTVGRTECKVSGEIPLCLRSGNASVVRETQRKRKSNQ